MHLCWQLTESQSRSCSDRVAASCKLSKWINFRSPRLLIELVRNVLQNSDKPSLSACALVSHDWLQRASILIRHRHLHYEEPEHDADY